MKILFLLPQIPYPPHSGGRIVTWNTVKRFAESCEVRVACLYHHPAELEDLDPVKAICHEVAAFPAYGKWSITPFLTCAVSPWPYKAHRFFNRELFDYVQRLARRESFDVIHAQNFYTTPYVVGDETCLKIHYKENVEGNILLRYAKTSRNPLIKTAAWAEGRRTRRFEWQACKKFDQILTISPLDRDTLLRLDPSLPIRHQRPGVDLDAYPFLDEPSGPPNVVFTGTMSYYPNSDGALAFLQTTWPLIKQQVPNIRCTIVGADPPEAIRRMHGHNDICITGRVEHIREYLQSTHIYIVPLRVGGGIRLKILEAMASGLAIVSTPIGCEGLEGKHGEHLLIAEMPDNFADAVIALANNHEKRLYIRNNARALAENVYDWDIVIRSQLELYRSLLSRRRTHSEFPASEQGKSAPASGTA
jgi:glycosyltransferase involved in cell wall biosynthesis